MTKAHLSEKKSWVQYSCYCDYTNKTATEPDRDRQAKLNHSLFEPFKLLCRALKDETQPRSDSVCDVITQLRSMDPRINVTNLLKPLAIKRVTATNGKSALEYIEQDARNISNVTLDHANAYWKRYKVVHCKIPKQKHASPEDISNFIKAMCELNVGQNQEAFRRVIMEWNNQRRIKSQNCEALINSMSCLSIEPDDREAAEPDSPTHTCDSQSEKNFVPLQCKDNMRDRNHLTFHKVPFKFRE